MGNLKSVSNYPCLCRSNLSSQSEPRRKLSAARFVDSVLTGLGFAPKHEEFLTVPGSEEQQGGGWRFNGISIV